MKKAIFYTLLLLFSLIAIAVETEKQPPGMCTGTGIEATSANDLQVEIDQFIAGPVNWVTTYQSTGNFERTVLSTPEPKKTERQLAICSDPVEEVDYPLETDIAAWLYKTTYQNREMSTHFARYHYQLF